MSSRPNAKGKIQYGESPTTGKHAPTSPKAGGDSGPMGAKIAIGVALLVGLVAVVAFAMKDSGGADQNRVAFQPATVTGDSLSQMPENTVIYTDDPSIGSPIPHVVGKSFDGSKVEIKPGEPMLIAVVAHWCAHCQDEVPRIVGWQQDGSISKKVKIIGIATAADESRGNFPPASWLEAENWTNETLVDTPKEAVMQAFGATGFPTLIAVTADGTVALRGSTELDLQQVQQLVDAALGKAPAASSGATTTTTP